MTDVELEIADSFERIFPVPTVVADWDDVRDRAEAHRPVRGTRLPSRRVVAIAAMIVVTGLLVAPAVAIGDHLLELFSGKSARGDVQTPAWSPDGRKLAFVSERDGNAEIYVMNADGSEQENLTRQPASDSHPSWSPDARKLAFVSRRDGNSEIYVMNADGSGLRNLTRTPSADRDPAWSPDGRAIAFVQECMPRPGDPRWRCGGTYLYVVNADGSGLRRLTTHPAHLYNPSWSADGTSIRYGRSLVRADGSGHSELPRNVPLAGAWSPDGQRIAVVSVAHSFADARNPTKLGLFVMNADGSNARRVAAKATSGDPAWSPDGRSIAFRRYDGQLGGPQVPGYVVRSAGPSDLFVVNADGSGLRRLTRHAENVRWFAWSPDGRTIAFLRNREVYIVKADGSGERRLTQLDK
jgi:Tol biopolymer transport system component